MTVERFIAGAVAVGMLAALMVVVRRRQRQGKTVNDPATVFIVIWAGTLLFYAVPVIDYVTTPTITWVVVYGSIITFLAGAWFAYRRASETGPAAEGNGGSPDQPESLSTNRLNLVWLCAGGLSLIGFAFFVYAVNATVGWQTMFQDPGAARAAQDLPQFQDSYGPGKALSYLAPVALLLWTLAFRDRRFTGHWRYVAPGVILVLLPYFFIGERLSLLFATVWIVGFHFVWRPVANPRRIAAWGVILFVAGLSFFYVIGNQKGATLDTYPTVRDAVTNEAFEPIALPYMYVTANVPVLGQLMQDPTAPTTFGQLTARPVSTLLHRILPISGNAPDQGGFYGIPFSSYNSATWLDPFFRDFGVLGALLLPGLFGFLATWIFLVARRGRTLVSSWLAAIGLAFVVFSPLKSLAPDALTWELLVLAPLSGLFVSQDARSRLRLSTESLQRRLRLDRRVITAGAAILMVAVIGVSLLALQRGGSDSELTFISAGKLESDTAKIVDSFDVLSPTTDGPEGDTQSITSRLGVSDTATRYVAMPDADSSPNEPGVIGVYADGGFFALRPINADGQVNVAEAIQGEHGFEVTTSTTAPTPTGMQGFVPPVGESRDLIHEIGPSGWSAVVLALALSLTAVWSLVRLPPFHPLQLWSIPWAIAASCFFLGLLPFIEISWLTVWLILGTTAALGIGVAAGQHLYEKHSSDPGPPDDDKLQALMHRAALIAIGLTGILLLGFLIQLSLRVGVQSALFADSDVRRAIGEGEFSVTVKYIYANLAAIALAGAVAGLSSRARLSRGWIATLLVLVAATYFTTARSNIFLAVVVAGVAFFMFGSRRPSRKTVGIAVVSIGIAALTIFGVMGAMVGKEFGAYPEFQEVPNFFQGRDTLSTLAIPYRYLSSSIPAFDLQVQQSTPFGQTHGCAMASEVCSALRQTGLDVDPVPRVKEFTAPYFEWNTFTSLDLPLIDFGKVFLIPVFALIGMVVGAVWAAARRMRPAAGIAYSVLAACLVGGYSTFFFTAPHIVGALVIALGCLGTAAITGMSLDDGKSDVVDPQSPREVGR